jgi:hypothetical protein
LDRPNPLPDSRFAACAHLLQSSGWGPTNAKIKTDRSRSKKAGSIPFFTGFCSVTMGGKPFSRPTRHGQLYDPPSHRGSLSEAHVCTHAVFWVYSRCSKAEQGAAGSCDGDSFEIVRDGTATACTLSQSRGKLRQCTEWFIGKQSSKLVTTRPCDRGATGTAPHGEKKTKESKNETCSR